MVDGFIGSGPEFRPGARLIMEAANANVAGMQQQRYCPQKQQLYCPQKQQLSCPQKAITSRTPR